MSKIKLYILSFFFSSFVLALTSVDRLACPLNNALNLACNNYDEVMFYPDPTFTLSFEKAVNCHPCVKDTTVPQRCADSVCKGECGKEYYNNPLEEMAIRGVHINASGQRIKGWIVRAKKSCTVSCVKPIKALLTK